jgi:hypothetical protein
MTKRKTTATGLAKTSGQDGKPSAALPVGYAIPPACGPAIPGIESVDKAHDEIVRFPTIGRMSGKYRVLRVKGFPYNFCYSDDLDGELVAITLFHHKQNDPESQLQ